jgi:hypothetical protein
MALEPIFGCIQRRRKYKQYELLEWQTSEYLQLQRLGYQGLGMGTWSHLTSTVPLTASGEILEPLALKYGDSMLTTSGISEPKPAAPVLEPRPAESTNTLRRESSSAVNTLAISETEANSQQPIESTKQNPSQ